MEKRRITSLQKKIWRNMPFWETNLVVNTMSVCVHIHSTTRGKNAFSSVGSRKGHPKPRDQQASLCLILPARVCGVPYTAHF